MKKRSLKKVALTLAAALAASAVLTACSSKTGGSDTQPASAEAGGATGTEGKMCIRDSLRDKETDIRIKYCQKSNKILCI